jgi:hypothetical protein
LRVLLDRLSLVRTRPIAPSKGLILETAVEVKNSTAKFAERGKPLCFRRGEFSEGTRPQADVEPVRRKVRGKHASGGTPNFIS